MNKAVKIILILVVLLLCCCVASAIGAFLLFNSAISQTEPVQNLAYELCSEKGDLTFDSYEQIFSEDYKNVTDLSETQTFLEAIFPQSYNCSDLKGNNILTLMTRGFSISTETDMNDTTATYDIKVNGTEISFLYIYENNDWYVLGIYTE